ncbi:MAG: AEC family transporter [Microvirga sp.]|jgi:malonate transporter|uniref:AEC family transporter n=1 Tax=Microvirga tunisiensis TaxID=2108360 RepID=A0A5N7MPR2_9HYPH|nr:AEC family transporter [Microvirga tunisiensis]MPR10860.1 AEC family transporter [Microvirga tunisiensis]MPR29012.1 AEC family transporter [Microvirga tunisiensis]
MLELFAIVLPVFGLIGIGYVARQTGFISERAGEGLSEFVFTLSLPCLIFRTLVRAEIPDVQPWGYWISYFVGVAVVWLLATVIGQRFFGIKGVSAVVAGFSAGQANTVFVGVPMILKAYGDEGAVPLFLLIAVHLPVTMTLATILAEGRQASPVIVLRRLFTHPIVVGILAGSACRPIAAHVPAPAWQVMDLLASAAVPCALISMGIALRRYGLQTGWKLPTVISFLKLVLHPLIVLLLATRVFNMPPVWAGVAVLFASCPSGINAYLFAERYGEGVALASSAITLSTFLALGTTLVWLYVLGVG